MISKYAWLLALLASVFIAYKHNYIKELHFVNKGLRTIGINVPEASDQIVSLAKKATGEQIFTINELRKYTNLEDGLYISILGQVFDVTKGVKHYGPGATYHAFTGKDASLAFITGEFNTKALTDDISSLSVQQVKALNDWLKFYKKNYIYKGKLNSRFYNEDGSPTQEFRDVRDKLALANKEEFLEEQKKRMFPPCNVEWTVEKGSVVWCSKRSGGIEREWVGVPRMLFESPGSQQYRCACVRIDSKEYEESKGSLREYLGCGTTSPKCAVKLDTS